MENRNEQQIVDFWRTRTEHYPDQSARWLLQNTENLRCLVQIIAGNLSEKMDFERIDQIKRSFVLEIFRAQESDLVYRVPFKSEGQIGEIVIYILIEHQSTVDETMGFRMLFYMLMIWDTERRTWEQNSVPKAERRLTPILPIVFYTGDRTWKTPLQLDAIMDIPDELTRFVPYCEILFLSIKEADAETLTKTDHPFGWLMTVLQQEHADKETISRALVDAVGYLGTLDPDQKGQMEEAIKYLISLILHRRPEEEHEELVQLIDQNTQQMEVTSMAKSMAQVLTEQGIEQGARETTVENILSILTTRFPTNDLHNIEQTLKSISNLEQLKQLVVPALQTPSVETFLHTLRT